MKWIKVKRKDGEVTKSVQDKMINNLPILIARSCPKLPWEKDGIKYEVIYDFSELLDYKIFYDLSIIKFVGIK